MGIRRRANSLAREGRILMDEDPLKLVELLVDDLQAHRYLNLEKLEQSQIIAIARLPSDWANQYQERQSGSSPNSHHRRSAA